jgi:hypothetical protein
MKARFDVANSLDASSNTMNVKPHEFFDYTNAVLAAHGATPVDGTAATGTAVCRVTAARVAPAMGC